MILLSDYLRSPPPPPPHVTAAVQKTTSGLATIAQITREGKFEISLQVTILYPHPSCTSRDEVEAREGHLALANVIDWIKQSSW